MAKSTLGKVKMIKLIATDIDGTLVEDSSSEVCREVPDIMHKLIQQGKICVVASGRQFESIKSMFHQIENEIVYIAENGAHIHYQGRDLFVKKMKREYAEDIIKQLRKYKDICDITVSTTSGSYLESTNQEFIDMIHYGYHNSYTVVEDVLAEDISIIKIAAYQKGSIRKIGEDILIPAWIDKVKVCMAGEEWVDFMDRAVDKGCALQFLQKYFLVNRKETMAFGDNENDIGMLQEAEESYAVENARDEVKQWAKYVCPSHQEKGVYQIIKTLL